MWISKCWSLIHLIFVKLHEKWGLETKKLLIFWGLQELYNELQILDRFEQDCQHKRQEEDNPVGSQKGNLLILLFMHFIHWCGADIFLRRDKLFFLENLIECLLKSIIFSRETFYRIFVVLKSLFKERKNIHKEHDEFCIWSEKNTIRKIKIEFQLCTR